MAITNINTTTTTIALTDAQIEERINAAIADSDPRSPEIYVDLLIPEEAGRDGGPTRARAVALCREQNIEAHVDGRSGAIVLTRRVI